MNKDSNNYLIYFIAITAIFCLSTGIMNNIIQRLTNSSITSKNSHKSLDQSTKQTFNDSSSHSFHFENNLEKKAFSSTSSNALSSSFTSSNESREPFDEHNLEQNTRNKSSIYSFKIYKAYESNPLFNYKNFLNWLDYSEELEQILKDDSLSESLLEVLQNTNEHSSKNQAHKVCNNKLCQIIENLDKKIKKNYVLDHKTISNPSTDNTFFTIDNEYYFSLQDYQKYENNPLFKEIAAKAFFNLDFFKWFTYKKELQIIFNDEIFSNCLLEILQQYDKELAQLVFYDIVNKINKKNESIIQTNKKDVEKN